MVDEMILTHSENILLNLRKVMSHTMLPRWVGYTNRYLQNVENGKSLS